ncbi:protein translocase subunit SecDF [Paraliobacillus ryukyuensis]|uniref:Multifunctional fusion protein n=1 Tax=Paraliobacillus ryukyuensis TaxID=200904 RepID=A0A366EFT7_9BACI|nr:protein translocase subunit SecDF [Paraliobacillus ryukyuensis]RBP01291.1 protein translocase subunit secF /protein translocase subunit secD [Paraliobacillus ryukyuensis]
MVKRGRIIAFFLIVLALFGTIGTTITGITKDMKLGLDLQGGVEILYEVEPLDEGQEVDSQLLQATVESLRQRVDVLGVSEPNFNIEEPNRIRVQLAGVENEDEARELLSTSAQLSFRDVNDKEYLDGSDIVEGSAQQNFDSRTNQPIVTVEFKSASAFGDVTREIMNDPDLDNRVVIWMDYEEGDSYEEESQKADPKYISAPGFDQVLNTSNIQIEGNFTVESAKQLADILNAGSLPVDLHEEYTTSVGAQFGQQAMDKTIFAGILGVAFIFLFMIVYYRFPGFIAVVTLSIYIYLVLLVFELMNGVLTLPGIAALILGVGMAVDANIITYERMKEELKQGKSMMSAFKAGNSNSLSTIFDANITTLIAATVLFIFGTSSVKGFATLLIVSIVLSFVTAVFGARFFLSLWVKSRFLNKRPGWFGVKASQIQDISDKSEVEPTVFGKQFDFVKHRKKFFLLSGVLVVAGALCLSVFNLNLGIDFTAGSRVEINAGNSVTAEQVEDQFDELGLEPEKVILSGNNNEIAVARFDKQLDQDTVGQVRTFFSDAYGSDPNVSTVSPVVGQELAKNALLAILYASIAIIIYVTIRFEFYFALTAILALLHDAFFILALFSITQLEFDVTIIAAILTIVGYSINDTIVTFDRIRENLKAKKRVRSFAELAKIVNKSLMQTLGRSINTVLTVIVAAIMLFFFGATSITNFSFALIVGLFAGTYSSLFIAAQVWLVWRGKQIKEKPIVYVEKKRNDGPQV